MSSGVFIAMPVYRGEDVIEETIRSILDQEFEDFHLVISVDGEDDPTVEICRKYTSDPRIDVVVQQHRLGWPGNFNWLVENCDREFFCYWQQDDLASTGYLRSLRKELLARPDASIAHTDVQWFGASFDRTSTPSIEGEPLSRVMQHIEAIRYEPLRGLIRSSMLPGGDAIPVTEDESCQEEFVFLTQMAAAGAFVRTDQAMYFKRLHAGNVFKKWFGFPEWRRRRGWLSMGSGMYHVARQHAPVSDWPTVLAQVADRLAVVRIGRGHFYAPPQHRQGIARMVRDFVGFAGLNGDDLGPVGSRPEALQRPVHEDVLRALDDERARLAHRSELATTIDDAGTWTTEIAEDGFASLLGYGWSDIEPWGVWTDGEEARLRIPAPPGRKWRATLVGEGYGRSAEIRIGAGPGSMPVKYVKAAASPLTLVVESDGSHNEVKLHLPDARSPVDDGLSDTRLLGFGLHSLTVDLV